MLFAQAFDEVKFEGGSATRSATGSANCQFASFSCTNNSVYGVDQSQYWQGLQPVAQPVAQTVSLRPSLPQQFGLRGRSITILAGPPAGSATSLDINWRGVGAAWQGGRSIKNLHFLGWGWALQIWTGNRKMGTAARWKCQIGWL